MKTNQKNDQNIAAKWGWGILCVVSVLLMLNGATWFFFGPQSVVVPLEEFPQAYPSIAPLMAKNAQQVAIWYLSFGLMALFVALEGYRHGSRWAWNASWILVAALVAVGFLYRRGFGAILLSLVVFALLGQLLASKGLSTKISEKVSSIKANP